MTSHKFLKGTFFVYFNHRYPLHPSVTEDDVNVVLRKYSPGSAVSSTYNSHTRNPQGYVWMSCLTAQEGFEQDAKHGFMKIARRVAYEVGDLDIDGPHCNVSWHWYQVDYKVDDLDIDESDIDRPHWYYKVGDLDIDESDIDRPYRYYECL
jgi:hypothetical protein